MFSSLFSISSYKSANDGTFAISLLLIVFFGPEMISLSVNQDDNELRHQA